MNSTIDPLALAERIQERYRRYLKTLFYFREPALRASFARALDAGSLAKGPYLEATPVFAPDETSRALFSRILGVPPDAGLLHAVNGDRSLYRHQARAVERVSAGHNAIVATGTGSGKTEAFLYPILLHLFQEFRAGTLDRPGVRALVLYPMNALANDQRERLGEIARVLADARSPFQFTFGQYIGETPEDDRDNGRHAAELLRERLPGEHVLRSEMRAAPPHILLTNYSMLEYLLLRPADSELFDNGRGEFWKFIVLDEAHQYRGARGIEMGLLLRRLKQRLREGGRRSEFRCIATSASLVNGDRDAAAVATFARNLFGEPFEPDDLILGETVPIPVPSHVSLTMQDYIRLLEWLDGKAIDASALAEIGTRLGIPYDAERVPANLISVWLERDARTARLRRIATASPIEFETLAAQLFQDEIPGQQHTALTTLVELAQRAESENGAPLLAARYHLFLRALEGAYAAYLPDKTIYLDRRSSTGENAAFEVALCRECGQHYFITSADAIRIGKYQEAARDPSLDTFGATYLRPLDTPVAVDASADEGEGDADIYNLCLECGRIGHGTLPCGHANTLQVVREPAPRDEEKRDQIARCGACGYHAAGRDPVREIVYGADGPHAVVTTTLFQALPSARRKILAFADGRQEAAFFAWYLDETYRDLLNRNLLLQAIEQVGSYSTEGASLRDVAVTLRELYRQQKIFPPASTPLELAREAWRATYRELLSDEQRLALEGVGAVRWSLKFPEWIELPPLLFDTPWSLDQSQAFALTWLLLDTMRADRGVELEAETGVTLSWDDLGETMMPREFTIGPPNSRKNIRSWDGKQTRRTKFLAKWLQRRGVVENQTVMQAQQALRALWQALVEADRNAPSERDRLLLRVGQGMRLNPRWYRVQPTGGAELYRCDTCNRLTSVSVANVCPRHACSGTLAAVSPLTLEPNHYRALYAEALPGALRVEEHTAQLEKETARRFQREFREGKIHVLSCSTTFELGVDLGNLDTIFLRNVPPESFNYVQRVGRAGRRRGFPGFALTYCRRAPHDLYHFAEPQRMMSGKVSAPTLAIQNDKIITRHITAVALAAFFRAHPERFTSAAAFVGDWMQPRAVKDVRAFLLAECARLENSLRTIVPKEMIAHVGLHDGSWIERVAGTYDELGGVELSRFVAAETEIVSDYQAVLGVMEQAKAQHEFRTADWAQRRANTIASADVLGLLSRKVVIPKYGFPVDVVELDTQSIGQNFEATSVSLQRDLGIAIAEFAPTSQLIANKKVWTSYALKRVAEKEWERRWYKRCAKHSVFVEWKAGESEVPLPCGDRVPALEYVIPAFGFTTNRELPKAPSGRPARVFSTRPYFLRALTNSSDTLRLPAHAPQLTLQKASPGLMVMLCEGRRGEGFHICRECGTGLRAPKQPHENAFGKTCRGTLERVALGHNLITDILRLQFHTLPPQNADPHWLAYGLAYALVEGVAETLDVPATDLNATVAHSQELRVPPVVLYDNVPGGAGLVKRLEDEMILRVCLETARQRVEGSCGCGADTSCYGCLRNYRNQFAHPNLQRGPVLEYFQDVLAAWI